MKIHSAGAGLFQVDGQTDRQTDGQTDGQTDRQTDRRTDRQTDRQTDIPHGIVDFRIFTNAPRNSVSVLED